MFHNLLSFYLLIHTLFRYVMSISVTSNHYYHYPKSNSSRSQKHTLQLKTAIKKIPEAIEKNDINAFTFYLKQLSNIQPQPHIIKKLFFSAIRYYRDDMAIKIANHASCLSDLLPNKNNQYRFLSELLINKKNELFNTLITLPGSIKANQNGVTIFGTAKFYENKPACRFIKNHLNITQYWSPEHTSLSSLKKLILNFGGKRAETQLQERNILGITRTLVHAPFIELWHSFFTKKVNWPFPTAWGFEIQNSLHRAFKEKDNGKIVQGIRKQTHPNIIFTETNAHLIAVVFFKNLIFICNRGENLYDNSPYLIVGKFDPEHYRLHNVIQKLTIDTYNKMDPEESYTYIYSQLFSELDVEAIPLSEDKIETIFPLSPQRGNNCVIASPKVAILASLIGYIWKNKHQVMSDNALKECWSTYKNFSVFTRDTMLSYIDSIYEEKNRCATQTHPDFR